MFRRLLIVGSALVLALLASACGGSVDASKTRSDAVVQSGGIVPAEELRVAEYLSYYKQNFPSPVDAALGLDVRLGNTQVPIEGGDAWVQIGVQARGSGSDFVAPLNVALVIDKSGSMAAAEKMPLLKPELRVFLHGLAPNDLVALVTFDQNAAVLRPSGPVGDGAWIDATVDRLQPGGSTNLNAGLTAGFQEVDRNFDVRRNNRVIVLTDGVANEGVTDPNQIAASARAYNDKGINLSTIGLGQDNFNDALLIQLANQGKGAYHFAATAADMDKIIQEDAAGLVQKAASDVSVSISPEPDVTVEALTGYDGQPPVGTIKVPLRDMGTGDTQVVLARLKVGAGATGSRHLATVRLDYQDAFAKRQVSVNKPIAVAAARLTSYDATWDTEVLRNVTVQRTAEGLKEIDRLYKSQRYLDAWRLAYGLEQDLRTVARVSEDSQMVKDADTMRTYEDTLAKWVERQTGQSPQATIAQPAEPSAALRAPFPTPSVAVIEIK